MGKVKTLTVTTHDEQKHVFEGDKDEIDTVREKLTTGTSSVVWLVNRQGKRVPIFRGSVRSIR